jgi:hypothetical protein
MLLQREILDWCNGKLYVNKPNAGSNAGGSEVSKQAVTV